MPGNELLREVHNGGANAFRMPAILRREDIPAWLYGTPEQAPCAATVSLGPDGRASREQGGQLAEEQFTLIEPVPVG